MTDITYPKEPQGSIIAGRYLLESFQKTPIEGSGRANIRKAHLSGSLAIGAAAKLRCTVGGSAPYLDAALLAISNAKFVRATGATDEAQNRSTFVGPATVVAGPVVVDAQVTMAVASPAANAVELTCTNATGVAVSFSIEMEILGGDGQTYEFTDTSV